MTIQAPEFEGSPESEHTWKDELTTEANSLREALTALTTRVAANETALAAEEDAPIVEVEVKTTSATEITPFTSEYPYGVVICHFTVNAASNSDSTFFFTDPDTGSDFNRKFNSRVLTNAATNNEGSMGFALLKDELVNGRVGIAASGISVAPFTVNKWVIIRYRKS